MMRVFHLDFERFIEAFLSKGAKPGYFVAVADVSGLIRLEAVFSSRDRSEHVVMTVVDYPHLQLLKHKGFVPVRRIAH